MNSPPQDVLDFWFGSPPLQIREAWFRKSEAFDDEIRRRFGAVVELALAGELPTAWDADPAARLARILLLDQFTRNIFRSTSRAFAGDQAALALAQAMVERGEDASLPPLQRWFVYLPFEHAEDLAVQERSVELFGRLAREEPTLAGALDYAERHRDVVRRFGRFPHRNAWLGRESTAEELEFLKQPGSSF